MNSQMEMSMISYVGLSIFIIGSVYGILWLIKLWVFIFKGKKILKWLS